MWDFCTLSVTQKKRDTWFLWDKEHLEVRPLVLSSVACVCVHLQLPSCERDAHISSPDAQTAALVNSRNHPCFSAHPEMCRTVGLFRMWSDGTIQQCQEFKCVLITSYASWLSRRSFTALFIILAFRSESRRVNMMGTSCVIWNKQQLLRSTKMFDAQEWPTLTVLWRTFACSVSFNHLCWRLLLWQRPHLIQFSPQGTDRVLHLHHHPCVVSEINFLLFRITQLIERLRQIQKITVVRIYNQCVCPWRNTCVACWKKPKVHSYLPQLVFVSECFWIQPLLPENRQDESVQEFEWWWPWNTRADVLSKEQQLCILVWHV